MPVQIIHRIAQSVEATGGVYKSQGRIRSAMMKHPYNAFLVHDGAFQTSIPNTTNIQPQDSPHISAQHVNDAQIPRASRNATQEIARRSITPSVCHCNTRAAQDIRGHHRPVLDQTSYDLKIVTPSKK